MGEPMKSKTYCRVPGVMRMEMFRSAGKEPDEVTIVFPDKPGIHIDHRAKSYRILAPRRGELSPAMLLHELGRYSGDATRKLGRKQIDESVSEGFEIDLTKIEPNVPSGTMELWVDVESRLPTQIHIRQGDMPVVMVMQNFKWNEEFSREIFDVTAPKGYADKTQPEESIEEQVAQIREALKLYAELSGGHYPKVQKVYGDATRDEMFKMAGINTPPTPEQSKDSRYVEIRKATSGLARINVIQRENENAAFHGIDVGPNDAGKVLFRWKLPDGRYQVIYGDLRSEAVSAERLKEIESL
jgi:outer membrane lipoprotein-sorting protein